MEEGFNADDDGPEDMIRSNFFPIPLPTPNEEHAITHTLDRMQAGNAPIIQPNINSIPINEFQTPGYNACAFSTLYPTEKADLHSSHPVNINSTEYFSYLLKYKDGRFAQYSCWRYFALNSQMRWRALQKGRVYVKQSLNGKIILLKK